MALEHWHFQTRRDASRAYNGYHPFGGWGYEKANIHSHTRGKGAGFLVWELGVSAFRLAVLRQAILPLSGKCCLGKKA